MQKEVTANGHAVEAETIYRLPEAARRYDCDTYGPGTHGAYTWELEKTILRGAFAAMELPAAFSYLDFAAGTGRICGFMASEYPAARGLAVDTSAAMLDICRERVPACEIQCVDLLRGNPLSGRTFQVITCFRFLLNHPDLRQTAMQRLWDHLAPGGYLIFNNHFNIRSIRGATLLYNKLAGLKWNAMSHRDIMMLLPPGGTLVARYGAGVLLPYFFRRRGMRRAYVWLDRRLSAIPALTPVCENHIYVYRKTF